MSGEIWGVLKFDCAAYFITFFKLFNQRTGVHVLYVGGPGSIPGIAWSLKHYQGIILSIESGTDPEYF